tara:strand:+ start:10687 stop:11151 length:465 start_codon:yes stop_codon:yes gene_type:complete
MEKETSTKGENAEIRYIKLVNGENIMATIIQYEDESVWICNPLRVLEQRSENGYMVAYMTKWIPFMGKEAFEVAKSTIVTMAFVPPETEGYYVEVVESLFAEPAPFDPMKDQQPDASMETPKVDITPDRIDEIRRRVSRQMLENWQPSANTKSH